MSIKNNIDKTEQLANNLKERVDSINQTITSNNGQSSNSLSDIPNNIKNMISKNYKKIAIMGINEKIYPGGFRGEKTFQINLDFTPKILLVGIIPRNSKASFAHSKYNNSLGTCINIYNEINAYIKTFDKQKITLYLDVSSTHTIESFEIIAIE